jgi:hypothetical protein
MKCVSLRSRTSTWKASIMTNVWRVNYTREAVFMSAARYLCRLQLELKCKAPQYQLSCKIYRLFSSCYNVTKNRQARKRYAFVLNHFTAEMKRYFLYSFRTCIFRLYLLHGLRQSNGQTHARFDS